MEAYHNYFIYNRKNTRKLSKTPNFSKSRDKRLKL